MVVPVKLLPWLFLIYGIIGPFTGEEIGSCIAAGVVGGVWLFIRYALSRPTAKPAAGGES